MPISYNRSEILTWGLSPSNQQKNKAQIHSNTQPNSSIQHKDIYYSKERLHDSLDLKINEENSRRLPVVLQKSDKTRISPAKLFKNILQDPN